MHTDEFFENSQLKFPMPETPSESLSHVQKCQPLRDLCLDQQKRLKLLTQRSIVQNVKMNRLLFADEASEEASNQLLSLVQSLLDLNPAYRITSSQILAHRFLSEDAGRHTDE
jgi:hypothetical protein